MNYQVHCMARRIQTVGALCFSGLALTSGMLVAQPSEQTTHTPASQVERLHPFTRSASIPASVDPATIRFEKVKATKVATELRVTMDGSYCGFIDEKTSLYCPQEHLESYVPAYEVTYSYSYASPAEEFGTGSATFEVYLRPEEVPAELKEARDKGRLGHDRSAQCFSVKTSNTPVRRFVVDEAQSSFCPGSFGEGSWTHTDARCEDKWSYKAEMTPPDSLRVEVETISAPGVEAEAVNRIGK